MKLRASLLADVRAVLGESPVWSPEDNRLVWIDMPRGVILVTDPSNGSSEHYKFGAPAGAIGLRKRGGFIVASGQCCCLLAAPGGSPVALAETGDRPSAIVLNDGKVDPWGGFVVGETCPTEHSAQGRLFRFDAAGERSVLLEGVTMSNGLDWSPGGRAFYYVDTATGGVDVFAVGANRELLDRRRLIDVSRSEGLADGLCIDSEGCLWLAIWGVGIVRRYSPDGKPIAEVQVPVSRVTSCAFGGARLGTLFITTASVRSATGGEPEEFAGGLFAVDTDTRGQISRGFG
jgi:sugar lactone lactonase YvrE